MADSRTLPDSPPGTVTFRVASGPGECPEIRQISEAVYVREHRYLNAAAATSDPYDEHAAYIIASDGGDPVGTVRVIEDLGNGLPTDVLADLGDVRRAGRPVEIGRLMTLPAARGKGIGQQLMRLAVIYGTRKYAATHIVGQFLVAEGHLRAFYLALGFIPLGPPVPDDRINGSPLCQVAAVDLLAGVDIARSPAGLADERLQYFLHDYDFSGYQAWVNGG